jgi:hypothetical protein
MSGCIYVTYLYSGSEDYYGWMIAIETQTGKQIDVQPIQELKQRKDGHAFDTTAQTKKHMNFTLKLHKQKSILQTVVVRYHCGGWPEEVNTCFLNSYMVYL